MTLTYKKPQRTLDVNGRLDGSDSGGTTGYGTFDVYLNGSCVANDVADFYRDNIADGTSYEIKDIKATNGKVYNGVYSGSASGSMCGYRSVYLKFDTPTYYLDVNGELDGVWQGNLDGLGSCDVYINGTCVADDVPDFWQAYPAGTKWEIRDIKTASGKKYRGITPGLSGTIGSSTASVVLQYTSGSTLSIDPNGGTYKGSSGVTTVNHLSPGATITVDSPTRPGYKFGGYEKSNESYQSYASNTGWTTSHGENVGTYSRSYDGNVSLNEAPDGGYYRTNHVWRGIDSATDNYNYISFPTYTAQAGHTYKISGEVWISERPSGGSFALNFYHGDSSNDWKHCMWGISEGWTGKWVKFSMERTFDTTTNDARFEIWTSNLKGLTGNISFWLQGLKITDETTGNDVSMTKIAMGDSDIKLTARWIPLHSTLSYDAQGGSLGSVKSTDNPNNYKIVDNGDYFIQSGLNSSRYLHDYDCSAENGAKVCTFQGYGANAKQCIWTFERYKNTPYYYIINKYNGKALNLSGDGPGDLSGQTVEMWTQLNAANENQSDFLWYFKDAGDGYVTICNKYTDKALDIPNGEDNDNVKLQQYTPNGTASQKFKLLNNSSSKTIELKQDGKVKKEITVLKAGSDYIDSEGKKIEFKKHNGQYMIIRDGEYLNSAKIMVDSGEHTFTTPSGAATIKTADKINGNDLYLTLTDSGNYKITTNPVVWSRGPMTRGGNILMLYIKGKNITSDMPHQVVGLQMFTQEFYSVSGPVISNSNIGNLDGTLTYDTGYDSLDQITDEDGSILPSALFDLDKDPEATTTNGIDFPTREKYTDSNVYINSATPAKKGCKFLGWNTKEDGSGKIYQPGDLYDVNQDGGNATLYAQWEKAKYTATVKLNGGSYNGSTKDFTISKYPGEEISIGAPTRSKHNFTGYKLTMDNNDGDAPTSVTQSASGFKGIMQMGNFTLNAQWTPWKHTVRYDANAKNDTSVKGIPASQSKTANVVIKLSSGVPTRNGYTFLGWNTKADGKGTAYAAGATYIHDQNGGTVTLYAQWTPWKHTVTYNKNVPASSKSQTVNSLPGNQTKIYDQTLTLSNNTPTRTGYAFKEWNTQADGKGTSYQKGASYTYNRTSDGGTVTLYAIWTSWKHTVHYDKNVSSTSSSQTVSNMPSDQTKVYETNLVLSTSKPTRNGYIFTGWNTAANGSGTAYAAGGNYQYDRSSDGGTVTLYAQWTAWKHTVHYDKNVPSTSSSQTVNGIPADQTKTFDQKLTLSATKPTRNGYIFSGWNTKANGSGTAYAAGAEYKHDQNGGTATLYAQWTPWKHTVHYNANGGDQNSVPTDQTKTFDQAMILSDKKPTRHGYNFVRWNTKADGTGTSYEVKGNYNHDQNGGTVTLYAIWTPWVHTVHYDANGGDQNSVPNDQKKTYGQSMNVATKVPTRNEYKFLGWTTGKDGSGTFYNPGDAYYHDQNGQTVTLYAKWIQLYTVKYDGNQPAIKGVTVTGSVANQTQGQDESVNLQNNNFKNNSGIFKDWSVGQDAYKYAVKSGTFRKYIHPEGYGTKHSTMTQELKDYTKDANEVDRTLVRN